jgi:membrane protease subunit HflK
MNDSHEHEHHHPHPASPGGNVPEKGAEDVGSRALSEALGSSFFFVKIVMVILIIVFFASGAVIVGPQERAVILRFGKPRGTGQDQLLGSGLHLAFPPPIDEVVKIPMEEIQTVTSTVGWYATPEQEMLGALPQPQPSLNPSFAGYTLSADGNIIHARATMGYRITDALAYAFQFVAASNVVQTVLDSALVWASARMTVDQAIKNTDAFKEQVASRVTTLSEQMDLGITISTLTTSVVPPRYVNDAFEAVSGAQQDRDRAIQTAQGEANALLATARAEADAIVNAGRSARTAYLTNLISDARSFSDQLPEYEKNPELFRQRRFIESWTRVLANAKDIWPVPENTHGAPIELRLLLNREPPAPRTNAPPGS